MNRVDMVVVEPRAGGCEPGDAVVNKSVPVDSPRES
jgi:hypothetical protein